MNIYRLRLKLCSLITALTVIMSLSHAQSYYFRHYQVENGLSNNTVFSCKQDKEGFIWVATKDGLDRFNGYSFRVFGNDSSGLGDSYVRSLYISQNDSLYAGTRIGVYKYNPLSETFGLVLKTDKEITGIQQDNQNNLWIVTGSQLIRYNENSHKKEIYNSLIHHQVTSVTISSDQSIYAGTADGFVEKKTAYSNGFTEYNLFPEKQEDLPKWIEHLFITKDNKILAGTSNSGVKLFDPNKNTSTDILAKDNKNNGIYARDFLQVSDSVIWIGTESGIFIFNTNSNRFINLANENGNPYSLSDNAVYTLCSDKEGGIWAGTYSGGINYYHPEYSFFTKYFPQLNKANSLSGNIVREICPDNFGNLWIGTEDAGLNKLNLKTNKVTRYIPSGSATDISYPNIHGLLDVGNKLLIGTFEHGLDIMDIPSGKVEAHYPNAHKGTNLKSRFIVTLLRSKSGVIYAGTRMGLYTFDIRTGDFRIVNTTISDFFIHTLFEDEQGNIWIGTMGSGLFVYTPENKRLISFNEKLNLLHSTGSDWITAVFQDTDKNIWIGTEGCGLIKYNLMNKTLENYSASFGFPGTTVYRILEDRQNTLWITTSGGLVRFNTRRKKIIKIYTIATGLLSEQFNYNSGYRDTSGTMYFGSVKGLISFNPANISTPHFQPPLYITEIVSGNKHLNLSTQNKSLIYDNSKIVLKHNQATFSVGFAALTYIAPEMTKYKYNMQGLDKEWRTTSDTKISFTSLPPGNYEFRLQAINSNGATSSKTTNLSITVLPPFWQSRIAYLLYTICTIALLFYIFRIYHIITTEKNKRKAEHAAYEREKERYRNKIDFFTNVAHEIRTPLTLIKAPLEKILKQADNFPGIQKYLLTMQRNTNRIINLSEELLDFRKTEISGYRLQLTPHAINPILKETIETFEVAASDSQIHINFFAHKTNPIANIDIEAFIKIINNLMINAVKYASAVINIETGISDDGKMLTIAVKSDGEKIHTDMCEKIFEPFYRSDSSKSKSGSGLGLTLARSLAILHGGNLICNTQDPMYNIFILTLPVTSVNKTEA